MVSGEFQEIYDPRQSALEVLHRSKEALQQAVSVVVPENPLADPLEVFPAPGERRVDDRGLQLSQDQQQQLRAAAAELGFGRETDRTVSELGLGGGHIIIEGGQAHKMLAEAQLIISDQEAQPRTIIFAASPYRQIKAVETALTASVLGLEQDQVGVTEYEVAKQVAATLDGFEKLDTTEILPFGYDINDNFAISKQATGQLATIGRIHGSPVVLLQVDRENYTDEAGNPKYRKQPDTTALLLIVGGVLNAEGDEHSPIALVTSGTYQASREVDGARAALALAERKIGVATYGTTRLSSIRGETTPPVSINQLPGELHKMAEQVTKLEAVLSDE